MKGDSNIDSGAPMTIASSSSSIAESAKTSPMTNGYTKGCYTNGVNNEKEQVVRLIVQALRDFGYPNSADVVERESGFTLQTPEIIKFKQTILDGQWDIAENLLPALNLIDENTDVVKFLIRQQKYMELLEARESKAALIVLRNELAPLGQDAERLHLLSSYVMCPTTDDLYEKSHWDGANGKSRQALLKDMQEMISPALMIPDGRLLRLIDQAKTYQVMSCLYHNGHEPISLYIDHGCEQANFPSHTSYILKEHQDEVWHVAFSHNGLYLASASKDHNVFVWSVTHNFKIVHKLADHHDSVAFVSWSPDDTLLLTCGRDDTVKLWNAKTGICIRTMNQHKETVGTAVWMPDGGAFISASMDKLIIMWNRDGEILHKWDIGRMGDLAVSPDGSLLIAADRHENRLHFINLKTKEVESTITESELVTCVSISRDSRYALMNVKNQELHLWDVTEMRLVRKYAGQRQAEYVIRSCFGGTEQNFIVSGSEDSNVYIWSREHGNLIAVLSGHLSTVNSVDWNPTDPYMFASAGDDHTIRIWTRPPREHDGSLPQIPSP